ncbi:Isochorismatase-like protein [Blastocladiella britannica]|nr:Isochorismatase-like protein [Blastocladiella britannica]
MLARLTPERTAFFLCDVQERFRPLIFRFPDVVATAAKMVRASAILASPLVVTEQHPKALGATVAELDVGHAAMVIPKTLFSMATPPVTDYLATNRISNVVLFGIESHVCVTQTALDLIEHPDLNLNVYVLADGVSSMNKPEIPLALKRLSAAGATITSSDSVLFSLLKDAKHDKFKQISALVKDTSKATSENLLFEYVAAKL